MTLTLRCFFCQNMTKGSEDPWNCYRQFKPLQSLNRLFSNSGRFCVEKQEGNGPIDLRAKVMILNSEASKIEVPVNFWF